MEPLEPLEPLPQEPPPPLWEAAPAFVTQKSSKELTLVEPFALGTPREQAGAVHHKALEAAAKKKAADEAKLQQAAERKLAAAMRRDAIKAKFKQVQHQQQMAQTSAVFGPPQTTTAGTTSSVSVMSVAAAPSEPPATQSSNTNTKLKENTQFKARPVNKKVLESAGDLGVPRVAPKKLTVVKEFNLTARQPASAREITGSKQRINNKAVPSWEEAENAQKQQIVGKKRSAGEAVLTPRA